MPTIETTVQYPVVITPELEKCRDFYVGYFGFDVVFEADWYIQLKHANGSELGFMKPDLPHQPGFLHGGYDGKGIIITYDVEDARREYEKAQQMEGLEDQVPVHRGGVGPETLHR